MSSFIQPKTVSVKDLPGVVLSVLKEGGYNRRDISVYPREQTNPAPNASKGERATVTALNTQTGHKKAYQGSFGGANIFGKTIDDFDGTITLVDDDFIITVTSSYPQNYASIECNPATAAKIGAGKTATGIDRTEFKALNVIKGVTSVKRAEYWAREVGGRYGADHPVVLILQGKGLIKINKVGSISVTTEGKVAHEAYRATPEP